MERSIYDIHRQFPAAPEYLGAIYIIRRDYTQVTNARLAGWMGVSASAVSQALGRLTKLGLATHKRYAGIDLTPDGDELARKLLRRHYLIEHLLVGMLGFPWEKADDEAKQLQSAISDELTEHLYESLGRPQSCPHGNPMPGAKVETELLEAPKLAEAAAGTHITVIRITEEGEQIPQLLAFCGKTGIQPGTALTITGADATAIHVELESNRAAIAVPREMAGHIRYRR